MVKTSCAQPEVVVTTKAKPTPTVVKHPSCDALSIAKRNPSLGDYAEIIETYPNGLCTREAENLMAELQKRSQNGKYFGSRGYTDSWRRSPHSDCRNDYRFNATINNGRIRFFSDGRNWTGSVSKSGVVTINRSGISPRTNSAMSISGHMSDAFMQSGYCGSGFFRLWKQ